MSCFFYVVQTPTRTLLANGNLWGGKWDFEKQQHGAPPEDLAEARVREISEEIGADVQLLSPLAYPVDRTIEDGKYKGLPYLALFFLARLVNGEVRLSREHDAKTWEPYDSIERYDLTQVSRTGLAGLRPLLMSTVRTTAMELL